MTWFYYVVAAVLGLIFGSFFNVVVYRLPRGETLGERSRCPACGSAINWYDNIPLVSYALLGGRCRNCRKPISWRYPAVELSTAVLFALMYWWSINVVPGLLDVPAGSAFVPELMIGVLLAAVAVVVTVVDITHGVIPNPVTLTGNALMLGLVLGLAIYRGEPARIASSLGVAVGGSAFFFGMGLAWGALFMKGRGPVEHSEYSMVTPEEDVPPPRRSVSPGTAKLLFVASVLSLTAAVVLAVVFYDPGPGNIAVAVMLGAAGGAFLLFGGLLFGALMGEEEEDGEEPGELPVTATGMGDAKLLFFTGLALGYFNWYLVFVQFLVASLLGVFAALAMRKGRRSAIPFGPFLALGAVVALVWGQELIDLYVKLLS